jgi:hypothetical protein
MELDTPSPSSISERSRQVLNDRRRRKIDWLYWPDTSTQVDYTGDSLTDIGTTHRPDIEDEAIISWGLAQSQNMTPGATIEVLCGEGTALCKCPLAIEKTCSTE